MDGGSTGRFFGFRMETEPGVAAATPVTLLSALGVDENGAEPPNAPYVDDLRKMDVESGLVVSSMKLHGRTMTVCGSNLRAP